MIDRQYIPLFVFVACLALALALAFFTNEWPTALAISLAGCAIALAMRNPVAEDHDTAFLEEDIAEIKAGGEQRDLDIAALRTSVDELAGIVESLAGDTARIAQQSGGVETDKLRALVDAMGKRVTSLEQPQKQASARLDTVEQTIAGLRAERVQGADVADLRTVEPVAVNAGTAPGKPVSIMDAAVSMPERTGRLRERLSNARKPDKVRAMPVFDNAGNPASLLLDDPADEPSVAGSIALLRHALTLVGSGERRSAHIFLRFSTEAITDAALSEAVAPVIVEAGDSLSRVVLIVPQAAFQGGTPEALAALRGAGAMIGLEQVTDWSADLAAMAQNGLRYISVDGPAMARSAQSQKGDPTRLKSVLGARGIDLIAANIETRMQLDSVNTLVPDFLAGTGLGEPTLMDVSA
jgi:hypothetical protein